MDKADLFKTLSLPGIDVETDAIKKEVWAIGGGKGGTGKTFLSANLGVALARTGKKVLLVDADLGCANLHTCLGVNPEVTLSDYIQGKVDRIEDVLIQTEIPNLALISGAYHYLEISNPKYSQKMKFIRKIHDLDFEYIILDLGAGTSYTNLDFFLSANLGILNVIPEPTSIENTYSFIKSTFYRRFKKVARDPEVRDIVTTAIDEKNKRGIRTPHDLIDYIDTLDKKTGQRLKETIYSFSPKLIVNQVRSKDDITLGFSMRSSCLKYFGIKVDYVGSIEYDDHVWRATKKKRPLLLEYPASRAARSVERAVTNLLKKEELKFDLILRT
ncbi:MAG: AAA family ATPase [Nitrospira sp.]|nr:MinD/ParA family protein [Candidatus Manganitrophaceae bacterium]HIL34974.1 MinD/ParA family protein [Candidatus Manganitrophaceae bacterium]